MTDRMSRAFEWRPVLLECDPRQGGDVSDDDAIACTHPNLVEHVENDLGHFK